MSLATDILPRLDDGIVPPLVLGTGELASFAYQGNDHDALIARIAESTSRAARLYDAAIACQLAFRPTEGLDLQARALASSPIYRVRSEAASSRPVRLLALMAPGDLMVNAPLDFITNAIDVRLDLLYLRPGQPLPSVIPDHDVAFFAISEADAPRLARLQRLFDAWPRPALNNPRWLPLLARDALARSLADVPTILSPPTIMATRAMLAAHLGAGQPLGIPYPCLIRPLGSHAGTGLARTEGPADLAAYLRRTFSQHFYLTAYEEYADADGLYRKSRIVFIDRRPFLCHMASSTAWMVHYLNAGMSESAARQAAEAYAMASFETGFARRHAAAFAALHDRLGFDYYAIDCAETRDGRLLVFEADTAAIIHLMDPPDLFPYKPPQMRKVFAAFEAMLRQHAELPVAHAPVGPDPVGHDPVAHGYKNAVMPPAPAPLRTTQADRREPSAGRPSVW